jgi:hypothetical protein
MPRAAQALAAAAFRMTWTPPKPRRIDLASSATEGEGGTRGREADGEERRPRPEDSHTLLARKDLVHFTKPTKRGRHQDQYAIPASPMTEGAVSLLSSFGLRAEGEPCGVQERGVVC